MTTKNEILEKALSSKEFDKRIDEAVPYRVKINTELRNEMKAVKKRFTKFILASDPTVSSLMKHGTLSDEEKEFLLKAKIKASKTFEIIKKIVHPNDGVTDPWRVNTLIFAFRLLEFASSGNDGRNYVEDVHEALHRANLVVASTKKIDGETGTYFTEEKKNELIGIIQDMDFVQGEICQNADKIKIDIYDQIEDDIKKSSENKCGISKGQFQKIVTGKANKEIYSKEKFIARKEKLIENEQNEIKSKEVVANKVEEF